jgi:hypothetical protein
MRQLCEENARLKRLVADLTLDKHILGEVLQKKAPPVRTRSSIRYWRSPVYGLRPFAPRGGIVTNELIDKLGRSCILAITQEMN